MAFKGLLFDLGNTLLYFDGDWPQVSKLADKALVESLAEAGLDLDEGPFSRQFRTRLNAYYLEREEQLVELTTSAILKTLLAEFGHPSVPEYVVEEALKSLYQVSQSYWIPEEDTIPTIKKLKDDGYRLGVISNAGDDADVQKLVDKAAIRPYLDFVLSSAASGIRKPDPEIFHKALDHWQFTPSEAAMVGDTLNADILGAKRAGIFAIWLTRRADTPGNHADRDEIIPDASIDTLAELPGLLDAIS